MEASTLLSYDHSHIGQPGPSFYNEDYLLLSDWTDTMRGTDRMTLTHIHGAPALTMPQPTTLPVEDESNEDLIEDVIEDAELITEEEDTDGALLPDTEEDTPDDVDIPSDEVPASPPGIQETLTLIKISTK